MANPGTKILTHVNIAPEVTAGTPIAPTRQLYMDGTGAFDEDINLNFHEQESRALRSDITRAPTQQAEDVTVKLSTLQGVAFDELVYAFAALNGTATGVGGTADKTWTQTPGMTSTSNAPKTFTLDVGDDIQNWRLQYVVWQTIKLSAARGGLTQMELNGVAQRAIKGSAAVPASNSAIKIVDDLWTVKFATTQAGLAGASVVANFLLDWDLTIQTGLEPRHYQDGNLYFGQVVEARGISAIVNLTVESTAQAISQFYDKEKAQTLDFIRLKNTGPVLGGSFYSSQIDLPVYYDKPSILDSDDNGVNLYKIPARVTYDATSAKQIQLITINSLAAL